MAAVDFNKNIGCVVMLPEGDIRKTMAARGLVNGRVPTKWEGFSFPNVTIMNVSSNMVL